MLKGACYSKAGQGLTCFAVMLPVNNGQLALASASVPAVEPPDGSKVAAGPFRRFYGAL